MPPSTKANAARRIEANRAFAKELRTNATIAERKLWSLLRRKQMAELRFRRQHPIGPYVADFFCAAAKLIVELDGDQHGFRENIAHDEKRTRYLNACGYRVLRFSNRDVLRHSDAVLEAIWRAVASRVPPPRTA